MQSLSMNIFKKKSLPLYIQKTILQFEPRNKKITFKSPTINRKIWSNMPHYAKEYNKNLQWSDKFSAVVRPINNTFMLRRNIQRRSS